MSAIRKIFGNSGAFQITIPLEIVKAKHLKKGDRVLIVQARHPGLVAYIRRYFRPKKKNAPGVSVRSKKPRARRKV